MRIFVLLPLLIVLGGCTKEKDNRPICPICDERATMQMHPRMSGTGIKSCYKCDNEHNFTKEGKLVNLFGKPLKKEYIKPELEGVNAKELEGVNAEELEQRESIWYLKGSETPYSGKAFRWGGIQSALAIESKGRQEGWASSGVA